MVTVTHYQSAVTYGRNKNTIFLGEYIKMMLSGQTEIMPAQSKIRIHRKLAFPITVADFDVTLNARAINI